MRASRALAIPAVAAIAVGGAVAFGGCGSGSDAATTTPATQAAQTSQNEAMKHEGEAMKHEDSGMKGAPEDGAMQDDGAMHDKADRSMKHHDSSGDQMER
jgi:hypothetical protein